MTTNITLDERAQTVEIADADGEPHSYSVVSCPAGLGLWACSLTRLDRSETYRVAVERGDYWRCSCPAWKYRKVASDACKHCEAARRLYRFLMSLIPHTETAHVERHPS